MEDHIFDISFELEGRSYRGWVEPSEKLNKAGKPVSFHVILNEVSFGSLSYQNCRWVNFEHRSSAFIESIGKLIEFHYQAVPSK